MTNGFLQQQITSTRRNGPCRSGKRADRVYLNAVEVFGPFAALVVVIQLAGKANATTAFWTQSFFWLRVGHAVVFWAAIPHIRTVIFTLGFVSVAGLFWELIEEAASVLLVRDLAHGDEIDRRRSRR